MDYKIIFSGLGILLSLGAFGHYYWSIIQKKTKPHVYTWLIFSLILAPSFFIQKDNGGGLGSYIIFVELIGCSIAFLLSLKYGEKNINMLDKLFLIGGITTIIAWYIFKAPYVSASLIILIDFLALLPTYRKCWSKPFEETIVMYIISTLIFSFSLLSIENYSFLTMSHQVAIMIFDGGLVIYILLRRKILGK